MYPNVLVCNGQECRVADHGGHAVSPFDHLAHQLETDLAGCAKNSEVESWAPHSVSIA